LFDITLSFGITDSGELFSRVDSDYDDTGEEGDDTNDEEDFEEGKTGFNFRV
jgi:hypothetical protein